MAKNNITKDGGVGGYLNDPTIELDELDYLEEILKLTGREDRLTRNPKLTKTQIEPFKNVLSLLRKSSDEARTVEARFDLFNRLLLTLGIKPSGLPFFKALFEDLDFGNLDTFKERVKLFRCLSMLEYGNFRFAYKILKYGTDPVTKNEVEKLLNKYFPKRHLSEDLIGKRSREYQGKTGLSGLKEIATNQLFTLGYLANEKSGVVNDNRRKLSDLLEKTLSVDKMGDFRDLLELAKKGNISEADLNTFVSKSGVPGSESLLAPSFYVPRAHYRDIIASIKRECISVDSQIIEKSRLDGQINTTTYLGVKDLDIYFATSMREPLHFTTNHAFIQSLLNSEALKGWKIHYFDPTQSYLPDHIQKGLVESLMIKRAKVTIYNAQEEDTFGKDSEAAVALGQAKDVIVYVDRLFDNIPRFKLLYDPIDSAVRNVKLKDLLAEFKKREFLTKNEESQLLVKEDPELPVHGKVLYDVVEKVARNGTSKILTELTDSNEIDSARINAELMHHGYDPYTTGKSIKDFIIDEIPKLEKRALMFKEIHPLSFQISSRDGVARGVIVTRSVADTAYVLKGLLIGGLDYEIVDTEFNTLLLEKRTRSAMRVVTKDQTLSTAFWSEFSREGSDYAKENK